MIPVGRLHMDVTARRPLAAISVLLIALAAASAELSAQAADAPPTASAPATTSAPATAPATTTATTSSPAELQETEAENKRKLAELLALEARGEIAELDERLKGIREDLDEATAARRDTRRLQDDLDYWSRRLEYAQKRLEIADLQRVAGEEKAAMFKLQQRLEGTQAEVASLQDAMVDEPQKARDKLAVEYREKAAQAGAQAAELEERVEAQRPVIDALKQSISEVDADEKALEDRASDALAAQGFQYDTFHHKRMRRHFAEKRQQIDLMITTRENTMFAIMRQATLYRRLAETYELAALILAPPQPSFLERHRKIIDSLKILAGIVVASYIVRLLVGLAERGARHADRVITSPSFSAKRMGTLASFAGSLMKLFIWVFGLVWILDVYGIDPAKTTGALGLVGLIMAGMFQQIVIDFIKGLDIIAGRHYNVGDFIEVDGKFGHVIDFNVKHTRLRTLSGQELNLPNSRCIPSRRFPDGFVDNYVDVPLKSRTDATRVRRLIEPICMELNQRLEPLKEQPEFTHRFDLPGNRAVLRYRLRVLPSCGWIITDHFIPSIKRVLGEHSVELAGEPTFFFINRIQTFRRLFSRELTEQEILQEAADLVSPTVKKAESDVEGQSVPTPTQGGRPAAEGKPALEGRPVTAEEASREEKPAVG